jgi:lipoprotein-releasing system permease protein
MRTSLFVAQRYLFSKKKKNFINFLTILSVIGVAIGSAALVAVLSVFNGLEELTRSLHTSHNPELKVSLQKGKTFPADSLLYAQILALPEVKALTEVIEDNALLRYQDGQMAVNVKGVSDNFHQQYRLSEKLTAGEFKIKGDDAYFALLGYGVQARLSVSLSNDITPLEFWYPNRDKKTVSPTNPLSAFHKGSLRPAGVLFIEQQFDQANVIVPIEFASQLMDYQNKRTSLEIKTIDGQDKTIKKLQKALQALLGDKFKVENREEQQAAILRAFKIERLFAYITFSFILGIASFKIFFSLAMLAIEKQHDHFILCAMGASPALLRNLYLILGGLIALGGALLGLLLGYLLVWTQQEYGFIKLGVETSLMNAYPVKMKLWDFILVGITVAGVTFLASWIPARNAALSIKK